MTLQEFANDFLESSFLAVEENGLSQEETVTTDLLEVMKDSGDVFEPELCHYKVRGIKVSAFDYDGDNDTLDLFVTIFKPEPKKVPDAEVFDAFDKALNFYNQAVSGSLLEKMDETNEAAFEVANIIHESRDTVKIVRLFVLTNGMCSPDITPSDKEENGRLIDYELWDIERVYQQFLIRTGKQRIEVDFLGDFNYKLKCLQMEAVSELVDEYLAILPAEILARVYHKYKQGLLEKNVRTFLQFKAKVNQGIRETIKTEPDMFFAYNNGISTTAESVVIGSDNGALFIKRIEGWQIVNGGQTTASIYATSTEKGTDLSKVFVQMKVSVVKDRANLEKVVPNISKFANSQTAIKDSDFSSNSDFHVSVETLSRKSWVPAAAGGKATDKWYYERTRGQYLDDRSRYSGAELRRFDLEYPKKQKFTKTDLAKFEMSWALRPHDVSKGAEKNYKIFEKDIASHNPNVDDSTYKAMVGKGVLYQEIDKLVTKRKLGGYKSNMVAYILSMLSLKSNKKLDLKKLWENQELSDNLVQAIDGLINPVWEHINNPPKSRSNISEWCKTAECWSSLEVKNIPVNLQADMQETSGPTLNEADLDDDERKTLHEANSVEAESWLGLSKWAKERGVFTAFDRKFIYNIGLQKRKGGSLSLKQAKIAFKLWKEAVDNGFDKVS